MPIPPPPHTTSTRSLIYKYAHTGDVQSLKNLNHSGQSLDALDAKGNSPLCEAVWRQDKTAVTALVQAGANSNHACMQKIPESYKTAAGLKAATTVSATGLSTSAVVGIGVGAAALIGGRVALAAGGGGGGSHKDACEGIVCDGENQHCSAGACVCNAGFTMFDGVCYETLACVNGAQNANVCVCQPGYAGALCDTCDTGYINQNGVCYVELTCGANQHQEANACVCDTGYGFYGTAECHPTLACKDGTQQGDICICNGHASGALCDTCEAGYGFHGTNACHADLACETNQHQLGDSCICDDGYGFYETNTCHQTLSCDLNKHQQGDTCVCDAGYEEQGGTCVFKQQNVTGSGSIFKLGTDTGYSVYNNLENITVTLPSTPGFKIKDNGTLINHADITGTASMEMLPLTNEYLFLLSAGIQGIRGTLSATTMQNKSINIFNNGNISLAFPKTGHSIINYALDYTLSGIFLSSFEKDTSSFNAHIENNGSITLDGSSMLTPYGILAVDYYGLGTGNITIANTGNILLENSSSTKIADPQGISASISDGSIQINNSGNINLNITQEKKYTDGNTIQDSTRTQKAIGIGASVGISLPSLIYNPSLFLSEHSYVNVLNTGNITLNVTDVEEDSQFSGITTSSGSGKVINDGLISISHADTQTKSLQMCGINASGTDVINSGSIILSNSSGGSSTGITSSFSPSLFAQNIHVENTEKGKITLLNGTGIEASYSNQNRSETLDTSSLTHSINILNNGTITIERNGIGISLTMEDRYSDYLRYLDEVYRYDFYPFKMEGTLTNSAPITLPSGTGIYALNEIDDNEHIFNSLTVLNSGNIEITEGTGISAENTTTINTGTIKATNGIYQTGGSIENSGKIMASGNYSSGIRGTSVINTAPIEVENGDNENSYTERESYGIEARNIENHGDITITYNYADVCGLSGVEITNDGDITITATGETFNNGAAGIAGGGGQIKNSGNITITDNFGSYNVTYGIYGEGSQIKNSGDITIINPDGYGSKNYGIYGKDSQIENYGNITITNNSASRVYGIYADGGSVYNAGTITINEVSKNAEEASYCWTHTCYHYNGVIYKTRTGSGTTDDPYVYSDSFETVTKRSIVLDNGATLATSGTLSSTGTLDLSSFSTDGTGSVTLLSGGNLQAQTISGNLHIDASNVTSGFNTTYTNTNAIQANNTADLNLISNSALFDASLAENGSDVVMQMKSFDELTDNKSLAAFLANNYAGQKNEAFFNELKSIGSAQAFTSALTHLTAGETLTRFTHEDLTALRDVNANMNALMFSNMDQPLFQNAGTFNAFSFQNDRQSSAQFALAHKRISPYTKIGYAMSTTHLNSDNRRSTTRQNDIFQAFTPIGYDRFGWQLISTPQIGFARAHYSRKGYNGASYDGIIEKRIAALMNEARYPIQIGSVTLAPTVEFNALFYNQKGNETKKAYSLTMPSDNTLSVEAGAGFHLETKVKGFSLTAGAMLYRELADPYNMKVGMNGMDGSFDLFDEQKKYRGVADLGFGYDVGPFNVYGNLRHFVETQNRTQMKAGLNIHF